jgi:hypothetical protein
MFFCSFLIRFDFFPVQRLDQWVETRPRLSPLELGLLVGSVFIAGAGPIFFDRQVTELLSPTAAACTYHSNFFLYCIASS